ncbi:MAG: GTP 3',8-cyclase MoaA [Propionibacteriaceae bacterium]|jgi:cyclic pyranopterin phosphate synthase|nr:GTP 3',8-cyclase MoaA [Propionibacteriaceae bacterium]
MTTSLDLHQDKALRASAPTSTSGLTDRFGRVHHDLRVSVTDRCSLRCSYCMPETGVGWLSSDTVLTATEFVRLVGIACTLGIQRVRLTGGEPLMRPDLVDIVDGISHLPQPPALALTTNGIGLASRAAGLARVGLNRINVSLDSIDPDVYRRITRRDRLDQVLAGLSAAKAAGLWPIKLNAVLQRGVNDEEASTLLDFAVQYGFELRFIEQMPLDGGHAWDQQTMVRESEILARLSSSHQLTPVAERGHSPARRWLVDGGPATVGVIAAVSQPFCAGCDRVRLTADGQLRNCLFSLREHDLRTAMREGASDDDLAKLFIQCVAAKGPGHSIGQVGFRQPARPMSAIGG